RNMEIIFKRGLNTIDHDSFRDLLFIVNDEKIIIYSYSKKGIIGNCLFESCNTCKKKNCEREYGYCLKDTNRLYRPNSFFLHNNVLYHQTSKGIYSVYPTSKKIIEYNNLHS